MNLNFQIATQWDELNEYQFRNIAYLLLNKENYVKADDFKKKLLYYLFVPELTVRNYLKFRKCIKNVPMRELLPYTNFIEKNINRTKFPKFIKIDDKVFYAPADRLANLTIEEFSAADLFFYNWKTKKSHEDLDRLITVLYREKAKKTTSTDIRVPYSFFDLEKRGKYIPLLDIPTKMAIGLVYLSCRMSIIKKYRVVFPEFKQYPNSKTDKNHKKYQSFSPAIISLAISEIQPLGEYDKVKKTLIDTFFSILTESILRQKEQEKMLRNNKSKK